MTPTNNRGVTYQTDEKCVAKTTVFVFSWQACTVPPPSTYCVL